MQQVKIHALFIFSQVMYFPTDTFSPLFFAARSQRSSGIGRLVVTIVEGCNLVKTSNGRHDPYCEVTMGEQSHKTKTVQVRMFVTLLNFLNIT